MAVPEHFFGFTQGRFLHNEKHEMAIRYRRYDVTALAAIAAEALGSKSCVNIEKLSDGMFNRALLLTMDDGKQAVAKVPNPNAGQPHYATASEVATMDFMRNTLKMPVPKVYTHCSRAADTPVGAEFVIMEKAQGVPLNQVWSGLELNDKFAIVSRIIEYQAKWSSLSYPGYGSLYYASDLPASKSLPAPDIASDQGYALGPTTGRDWITDSRYTLSFDRGPWKSLKDYLVAIGHREMSAVKDLAQLPSPQVTLCGPGLYQQSRDKKIRAIEYYIQAIEHLMPSDPAISKPSAWHSDLHTENIFVDPADPTNITCIIDWQSIEVAPLFVEARQPYILDHAGPKHQGLDPPSLPEDFAQMTPEEQQAANQLLEGQALTLAYKHSIRRNHPDIWKALEFVDTEAFDLLVLARSLLVDGEAIYATRILDQIEADDGLLKNKGISITPDTIADIQEDAQAAVEGMQAMSIIHDALEHVNVQRAYIDHEHYDEAKDILKHYKEQIASMVVQSEDDRAAFDKAWPFDD